MTAEARFGPGAGRSRSEAVPGPRTALPIRAGRPRHGNAHRARLEAGLQGLGAPSGWLADAWDQALQWACRPDAELALRVQVDPGAQALLARTEPLPPVPADYTLVPHPHPIQGLAALGLVTHKGCLGPWHAAPLAWARAQGAEDVLLLGGDGGVRETAIAAVGLEVQGRLRLPPPEGRVRSLSEVWDLPAWADERGWTLVPEPFTLQEAARGTLWCFNALRGLWRAHLLPVPPHP